MYYNCMLHSCRYQSPCPLTAMLDFTFSWISSSQLSSSQPFIHRRLDTDLLMHALEELQFFSQGLGAVLSVQSQDRLVAQVLQTYRLLVKVWIKHRMILMMCLGKGIENARGVFYLKTDFCMHITSDGFEYARSKRHCYHQ